MASEKKVRENRWPPVESNPEVLTKLGEAIGLNTAEWALTDVFGLDEELLAMLPQPVIGLILLFPSASKTSVDTAKQNAALEKQIFFIKQVYELDDACGTIALIHSITNIYLNGKNNDNSFNAEYSRTILAQGDNNVLLNYINNNNGDDKTPEDKGVALANNKDILKYHSSFAEQGQTQGIPQGVSSKHHFVAFININNHVFELDGCKPFPIDHGAIPQTQGGLVSPFLTAAADAIKKVYLSDTTLIDFSIIALAANNEQQLTLNRYTPHLSCLPSLLPTNSHSSVSSNIHQIYTFNLIQERSTRGRDSNTTRASIFPIENSVDETNQTHLKVIIVH